MARYLEETILSVLANLRPGDEYFVIDGGSRDGSVDIIRKYADRMTGWVSEPDRSYAEAIGKGFDRATGDILCWINAGDLYLAGAFDRAREAIDGLDLVFGDDFHIDEGSCVLSYSRGWVSDIRSAMLRGGWSPLQDACFWRRDLYGRVGGIDRSLQFAADYDLFLRMAIAGRGTYVPFAFSAFRRHSGQKSVSGAVAYRTEREAVRRRERRHHSASAGTELIAGAYWRVGMSARARLGPLIWKRPDLVGKPIGGLSTGTYWPPKRGSDFD